MDVVLYCVFTVFSYHIDFICVLIKVYLSSLESMGVCANRVGGVCW